jgi:hypothetical protein
MARLSQLFLNASCSLLKFFTINVSAGMGSRKNPAIRKYFQKLKIKSLNVFDRHRK